MRSCLAPAAAPCHCLFWLAELTRTNTDSTLGLFHRLRSSLCASLPGMLRFVVGGPWYATLPDEAWPAELAARAAILKDFEGLHGDRRCVHCCQVRCNQY